MNLETLMVEWRVAKQQEREAIERRRAIEDQIKALAQIDEASERTHILSFHDGALRIVTRLDRKVDVGMLKILAREHGLEGELEKYFRWKAEVNLLPWRQAPQEIVSAFAPAITTRPTRPTFEWGTKGDSK